VFASGRICSIGVSLAGALSAATGGISSAMSAAAAHVWVRRGRRNIGSILGPSAASVDRSVADDSRMEDE
jgi:hypothetical protein